MMKVSERTPPFWGSLVWLAAPWDALRGLSSTGLVSLGGGIWVAGTSVGAVSSLLGLGLIRFRGLAGAMKICA